MRAQKMLSSRQIFRYAVPARTVTKKALHKVDAANPCLRDIASYLQCLLRGESIFSTTRVAWGQNTKIAITFKCQGHFTKILIYFVYTHSKRKKRKVQAINVQFKG